MFCGWGGMGVEIYPREGTETSMLSPLLVKLALKFIPVRGRKPFVLVFP